jgi:hypothetical protein
LEFEYKYLSCPEKYQSAGALLRAPALLVNILQNQLRQAHLEFR